MGFSPIIKIKIHGRQYPFFLRILLAVFTEKILKFKKGALPIVIFHLNIKILDLAIKYGYEAPESFARSFKVFIRTDKIINLRLIFASSMLYGILKNALVK
jgi:hypothetical protein